MKCVGEVPQVCRVKTTRGSGSSLVFFARTLCGVHSQTNLSLHDIPLCVTVMNHHVTYTPANLCFQSVAPVCSEINECQGDTLLLAIHVPPCLMLLYNFYLFTILMPFVWFYALQLFFSRFWEQQPHIFAFVHLKPFASGAEPLRIVVMNMTEKETCTSISLLFSHKKPCAFPQIPKQGWAIHLPKGSCEKLGPWVN